MLRSLVGSEMCIRDRYGTQGGGRMGAQAAVPLGPNIQPADKLSPLLSVEAHTMECRAHFGRVWRDFTCSSVLTSAEIRSIFAACGSTTHVTSPELAGIQPAHIGLVVQMFVHCFLNKLHQQQQLDQGPLSQFDSQVLRTNLVQLLLDPVLSSRTVSYTHLTLPTKRIV
eukprot:TRINITY_DN24130_c0_g1_i3.p1 TRINITY_DN24130_c0_g1~~TRINITY_DN24130_c0_g1_i3.p1  ORF type:complete len:169 (+),score=27.58 TRINITY_DN24130_c0_g1_i3:96-602(+)